MPSGIDTPIDAGPFVAEIKKAELFFVGRYYRNSKSRWPTLSASEAKLLSSAGISLVALWEWISKPASYFSHLAGTDDGTSAYHQAHAIGQPSGTSIYFAVDFDASPGEIAGPIRQYFGGLHAAFTAAGQGNPAYRIGVYGSGAVCTSLLSSDLVQYTWLARSTGWRGYKAFKNWNIKQGAALSNISFDNDSNEGQGELGSFRMP